MIFLISIVFSLVFFLSFVFYFGARDWRRMIFQRVHLCIWAIGGHELGTLSIRDWQFMTIHELWNSIIFLNFKTLLVIAPPSSLPPTHTHTHTHTHQRHYGALNLRSIYGVLQRSLLFGALKKFFSPTQAFALWRTCLNFIQVYLLSE